MIVALHGVHYGISVVEILDTFMTYDDIFLPPDMILRHSSVMLGFGLLSGSLGGVINKSGFVCVCCVRAYNARADCQ